MNLFMIGGFVSETWMEIWLSLNWVLYSVVGLLYRVFSAITYVNLFNKSVFEGFTDRMYIVVAMAMIFIFAYNLILMIINPEDKKGTGQATKLIKETIISLVLVILLPTIFNYMAIFQKDVLDSQIITKIIMGTDENLGEIGSNCDFSSYSSLEKSGASISKLQESCNYYYSELKGPQRGAFLMSPILVSAFLYPIDYDINSCQEFIKSCDGTELEKCDSDVFSEDIRDKDGNAQFCGRYFYAYYMSVYNGSLKYLLDDPDIGQTLKSNKNEGENKIVDFNYFCCFIAGVIALIMYASYTLMVGIRVAKLGFLQLIAPIPVMMRIIPKQKEALFDKWFKELKNTYLDVFMRLIIINFCLYAVSQVPEVFSKLSEGIDTNVGVVVLAKAVVVLGIMQFAKEAPGLFKEFFGGSGNFSIKGGFDKWKTRAAGLAGVAGVGAVAANRIANLGHNYRRIANNTEMSNGDKALSMLKNTGRLLNPIAMASAMKNGYENTKDGKNFLQGVNDATTKSLTQKGLFYKAKRNGEDALEQFGRLATTDFTTQDTKRLKGIIATTDDFTKKQKGLFSDIDDHKHVKAINNYYDRQIEEANKHGNFNAAAQLGKDRKQAVEKMRQAVMEEMLKGHEAKVTLRSNGTFAISNDMSGINNDLIKSSASTALENIGKIVNENPDLLKKALENNSLVMENGEFSQTKFDGVLSAINKGDVATLDKVGKAVTNLNKTTNNTIIEIQQKNSGNK